MFVNKDKNTTDSFNRNYNYLKKTGMYDFLDLFYKHVGNSDYYETYTTAKEIIFLQNFLELNKIRYTFTCVDNHIFESHYFHTTDQYMMTLVDQINWDNWVLFPDKLGFNQWATENNYEYATTHPLEKAHTDGMKYILEKINVQLDKENL